MQELYSLAECRRRGERSGGFVPTRESFEAQTSSVITAVFDGDFDRAASLIEPSSQCDADDLDRAYIQNDARINLIESVIDGERARVWLDVEFPSGGPLGGVYSDEHTLRLVTSADSWFVTGVP